jgi:hypothetical protein
MLSTFIVPNLTNDLLSEKHPKGKKVILAIEYYFKRHIPWVITMR